MDTIKNRLINRIIRTIVYSDNRKKDIRVTYHFDREALKDKPIILLSDHSAVKNFSNIFADYFYVSDNIIPVIGNVMDYAPKIGPFLKNYPHVSKKMYVTDFKAAVQMVRYIKKGKSLLLFPEGTHSFCGMTHPVSPALGGFLKKFRIDVVLASTKGAYLSTPFYSKEAKSGPVEVDFFHLFTGEDLKEMDETEIYDRFMTHFEYNDFRWNAEHRYSYTGEKANAAGIEKILYKCPCCHREGFITTGNNRIICGNCGNSVTMDDTYALYPSTEKDTLPFGRVDEWFLSQRQELAEEIRKNAGFLLKMNVELNVLNEDEKSMFKPVGKGEVTISRKGVTYSGTEEGEAVSFTLPISSMTGSSNQYDIYMVMYRDNDTIAFDCSSEKPGMIVKACGAIEELHALSDSQWEEALRRVYPLL